RAEAAAELEYTLSFTAWFAGEAERVQGACFASATAAAKRVFTIQQPLGVAAALVPWNFPVAMVLRKAGAALAAGCTLVVKPSPLLVQAGVYERFVQRFKDVSENHTVGHGDVLGTTLGPLTTPQGVERAEGLVRDALERGARLVLGGQKKTVTGCEGGYFFEP